MAVPRQLFSTDVRSALAVARRLRHTAEFAYIPERYPDCRRLLDGRWRLPATDDCSWHLPAAAAATVAVSS
jgi:hypothetical protein